ncbi:MAG: hypothetical protein IPG05_12645 [Gemmatimonadetes bacterium]|nr:hypothetical protein [Gemmatimonadota bacterium]
MRIVENTAPLLSGTRSMQLSKAPILSFMPDGRPDYDFGGVASVLRLKDGRIIVAAKQAPEFRLFDARKTPACARRERDPHAVGGDDHGLALLSGDTIAVRHFDYTGRIAITGDSLRQLATHRQQRDRVASTSARSAMAAVHSSCCQGRSLTRPERSSLTPPPSCWWTAMVP